MTEQDNSQENLMVLWALNCITTQEYYFRQGAEKLGIKTYKIENT